MHETLPYQILADVVLTLHVVVAAFIVGGLLIIIVGNLCRWRWVNALWFRLAHLAAIAIVVVETWIEVACPLTSLEMWLREKVHAESYAGSFIEHWLQRLLYYEAPAWVFTLCYSLLCAVVVATWWYFPPRSNRR